MICAVLFNKVCVHLIESLLIDVVDKCKADELKNCGEEVKTCNEPAHILCGFEGLTCNALLGYVAENAHKCECDGRINALCELTEEGVKRVNGAVLTSTELPLIVVDSIAHHSPGYASINTHTNAEEYKADHINHKREVGRGHKGEYHHNNAANKGYESTENGCFLLAVLINDLLDEGDEEYHRKKTDDHNDTGKLCLAEVGSKHNGVCGGSRLHTEEHTHSSESNADLSADLSPHALARMQGVSPGYLSTVFKKATGQTLSDYIRSRRMERAAHLLGSTNLQIQTVALHCGIMDVQYFSKLFKKQMNLTPSDYRASRRAT